MTNQNDVDQIKAQLKTVEEVIRKDYDALDSNNMIS